MLTPGDVRQWVWCPRVVWYRKLFPGAGVETYKMQRGGEAQERVEGLEWRRTLGRYGWEGAERRFGCWLFGPRTGMNGKPDLLLIRGKECAVVDYKLTSAEPGRHQIAQLAAYAMLAEEVLDVEARDLFLYRIPDDRIYRYPMGEELRREVQEALGGMERMIAEEVEPAGTGVRGRCMDCEYANFCGDVW